MAGNGPLFAGLRAKNQRPVTSTVSTGPRANNTTHANSISLSAGNLILGASDKTNHRSNFMRGPSGTFPAVTSGNDDLPEGAQPEAAKIQDKSRSKQVELCYHESRYSNEIVEIDLAQIPGAKEGDLFELKTYQKVPGSRDKKIYFIAKDFNPEIRSRVKNAQLSILSGQLQSLLDLPSRSKVWIKLKSKTLTEADLVELNIKDCLINRGDMWCINAELVNHCVFSGQKMTFLDTIRALVNGIYREGKKTLSGYIGENTRVVFRSESARLIFLIQITDEMWNFEETGEQLFQKMVNSFFPKIFKKWKDIGTHHSITIAFAVSMDTSQVPFRELEPGTILKNTTDYFRIVVDQVLVIHWVEIMETLRKEFQALRRNLLNVKTEEGFSVIKGRFSPVIKSNILELVNFASTLITDPFRQSDLRHTTTHVMIISPGSGLYDVDYDLLKLTGKKLLSLEMTMDLICLSRAPLHVVPLFRYLDYENRLHHCSPTWLSIFFWNDSIKNSDDWRPRCKIYDLQMMGLTENDVLGEVAIEHLVPRKGEKSIQQFMDQYDKDVFSFRRSEEFGKIEDLQNINVDNGKLSNANPTLQPLSSFNWNAPKFATPALKDIQKPKVFADLYTQKSNRSTNASDEERSDSILLGESASKTQQSLAVNTLKGIGKKNLVKDLTQKIVNSIIPDRDVIKGNYFEEEVQIMNEHEIESSLTPRKSISPVNNYRENGPIIKKNLSALDRLDSQSNSITIPEDSSGRESARTSSRDVTFSETKPFISKDDKKTSIQESVSQAEDSSPMGVKTWIEIKNPSVPVSETIAGMMFPMRWKDVLPRYVPKRYSKWRSFTTPAELPVTISDFPSKLDFETNFFFRNHSVNLNIDQEAYKQTYKDLLRNMIYMRLLAGFQLCIGENAKEVERSKGMENGESPIAKFIDGNWVNIKIYMMMDSEIHRISCGIDGVVDVQRYLRKNEENPFEQVSSYTPLVKTRYENEYRKAKIDPLHAARKSLNWNQIDQVLAGYGDYGVDKNACGFRSKLVVLPADIPPNTYSSVVNGRNETLTPEEIRLEGLSRLISSISRSRLLSSKEEQARKTKKQEIQPEILFYTGSLFDFIREQKSSLDKSVLSYKDSIFADRKQLRKDVDIWELARELQHGENSLALVNRKWHWKRHQNSFIGSELVNWLLRNLSDIDTREEAVAYGQTLMDKGLFKHVLNKHGFLDGHYFYQIIPPYLIDPRAVEKANSDPKTNDNKRLIVDSSSSNFAEINVLPLTMTTSNTNSNLSTDNQSEVKNNSSSSKSSVMLSNSLVINVDPAGKSYKLETCTVHYDKVHNPDHCFHIRLEWLTTTPKLLDDLVANWSRLCERYGLRLVEIPWRELCMIPAIDPFHSFVEIQLAINPWKDPEFRDEELLSRSKFYYHMYLLKVSGFLLDNRASKVIQDDDCAFEIMYSWGKPEFKYAQYIHITGAYIAEVRESGDLFLAPNNVYISRANPGKIVGKSQFSTQFALDAQKVMLSFKKVCTDYNELRSIFFDAKDKWIRDQQIDEY
ncbi:probable Vacuolar membrane-associated protein IML1 [Zygosaccharomyces bailii ISA1307]|nr:probable Vacuolar membrane-associated protein IML1 [Zygosaccharomyces bailii ISA1307]